MKKWENRDINIKNTWMQKPETVGLIKWTAYSSPKSNLNNSLLKSVTRQSMFWKLELIQYLKQSDTNLTDSLIWTSKLLPNLTGVSTTFLDPAILCRNIKIRAQGTLHRWKKDKRRAYNNLCKGNHQLIPLQQLTKL